MQENRLILSFSFYACFLIIPSYNPDFYFSECLQSVANQTLDKKRFEVIIVINGCTIDSVRYILKQLNFLPKR